MIGLALLWLLALILVLTGGNGEPTIVNYFVMPGGLIIVLIGVYPFQSSKQHRKNTTDQTLEYAARKVVPKKVAQLDTLDTTHYLVWTEAEWERQKQLYKG
jgi:hypothetical protein